MIEFARRAVRQTSVSQETEAKAGTLPSACYETSLPVPIGAMVSMTNRTLPLSPSNQTMKTVMKVKTKMTILNLTQMKVTRMLVSRIRQGSIATMNRFGGIIVSMEDLYNRVSINLFQAPR